MLYDAERHRKENYKTGKFGHGEQKYKSRITLRACTFLMITLRLQHKNTLVYRAINHTTPYLLAISITSKQDISIVKVRRVTDLMAFYNLHMR